MIEQTPSVQSFDDTWPELPFKEWGDTCATLHLWTQIVGKVRLACTPWTNHSWHVPLYVTARGLTSSLIPHGRGAFQIDFDFVEHQLRVSTNSGGGRAARLALEPRTVASFYAELMGALDELGVGVEIDPLPTELPDPIPFPDDTVHASYDGEYVRRWWHILIQSHRVFHAFRARFIGKNSPVHLFWGGLDLAVTRFSGRTAPRHPGGIPHLADWITREAYSHEVSSAGFWPGNADAPNPIFYSYAYPTPEGFKDAKVEPEAAFWYDDLGEFVLPYDAVRQADDPDTVLDAFLETTYAAAAGLAGWDRKALEAPPGFPKSS
ncbi:MAG: DUF5996 family protein [Gemmatimonadales bacterium]